MKRLLVFACTFTLFQQCLGMEPYRLNEGDNHYYMHVTVEKLSVTDCFIYFTELQSERFSKPQVCIEAKKENVNIFYDSKNKHLTIKKTDNSSRPSVSLMTNNRNIILELYGSARLVNAQQTKSMFIPLTNPDASDK